MDSKKDIVVTARQVRAARALLGWSREQAAQRCGVGMATLNRIERDIQIRDESLAQVVDALEEHGIAFFADDRGLGVSLRFEDRPASPNSQ